MSVQASVVSGDRLWRMPLYQHYTRQMTECQLADLNNSGSSGSESLPRLFCREGSDGSNFPPVSPGLEVRALRLRF